MNARWDLSGVPHPWNTELGDNEPCTVECWTVPDGWQPDEAAPEPEQSLEEMLAAGLAAKQAWLDALPADLAAAIVATEQAFEDELLYGSGPRPGEPGFRMGGLMRGALNRELAGEPVPGAPLVFDRILPALDTRRWRFNQQTKTWEAAE
jgi:hypothetical protein